MRESHQDPDEEKSEGKTERKAGVNVGVVSFTPYRRKYFECRSLQERGKRNGSFVCSNRTFAFLSLFSLLLSSSGLLATLTFCTPRGKKVKLPTRQKVNDLNLKVKNTDKSNRKEERFPLPFNVLQLGISL